MSRQRYFHGLTTRWCVDPDWGEAGWDGQTFLRYKHPYDLVGKVPFDVVPIEGREVAVVRTPITNEVLARLLATPRPSWIDVIVTSSLRGAPSANARIDVDCVAPLNIDPTTIAAAVATAYRSEGDIWMPDDLATCVVRVMGEEISLSLRVVPYFES